MFWSDVNFHPGVKTLRQFAALAALFLLAAGGRQLAVHSRPTLALVFAALAVVIGVVAITAPSALRWLFVGLTLAAFPIGWLMSWIVLGGLYYLLFTPIAVWFRLTGRDALDRRYSELADSYWVEKPPVRQMRRYFRQY